MYPSTYWSNKIGKLENGESAVDLYDSWEILSVSTIITKQTNENTKIMTLERQYSYDKSI